ncbi:PREDICTED: mammalian ependymin-related protein 1-like [Sturnus vulgaris]|uniref:mammalian ependymin-related protein 1-like n=1 Tax=Sturnus vulgaris TaxID=9172 RepID=UPI00071A1C1A|nr:PREDICTED: mammalian ependymin-related protein 1-like [Sturnus vulgaris]
MVLLRGSALWREEREGDAPAAVPSAFRALQNSLHELGTEGKGVKWTGEQTGWWLVAQFARDRGSSGGQAETRAGGGAEAAQGRCEAAVRGDINIKAVCPSLGPGPPLRLRLLLGVLLLRGGEAAAEPCQAPRHWERRTVFNEHGSGRNTRAAVSYDGPNQRLRVLEERKALIPCKKFFEYILLYKDAVMFQIEQVTKLCSKIPLTEPWDPYDIPANSTYENQYYIGGPGDEVMVQEWSDRKPARKCM